MPRSAVPTVGELEARIDEAVVIARASEEGVREVGELAIDAAKQARRAAEAAEQSARAAAASAARPAVAREVAVPAGPVTAGDPPPGRGGEGQRPVEAQDEAALAGVEEQAESAAAEREEEDAPVPPVRFEERFRRFSERADRVSARLRALEDHPLHRPGPSVGAARRRGDG
ncbi:MAG TPA: hypothetical protein VFN92_03600 [Solirubrobacterales bacterium]|nr:hypothetical protein [Solirubrobacterales bacterium]